MASSKFFFIAVVLATIAALLIVPTISQAQNFGSITLATGFTPDPRTMRGTAGGGISAQSFGDGCRGWVNPQPDHHLVLATPIEWLRIFVRSNGSAKRAPPGTS